MKLINYPFKKWMATLALVSTPITLIFAQGEHGGVGYGFNNPVMLFGIFELPILFLCVYYSFQTAKALKGGILGQGMNYLAWGFLVMAVGHIAMQIHNVFHYDVFRDPFGPTLGNVLWFVALIITWGLSAYGFFSIYNVSKK